MARGVHPLGGLFLLGGRFPCSTWFSSWPPSVFSPRPSPTRGPVTGCEDRAMTFDYWIGGAVSVLLAVYLLYALLRPERF
jgi:K+-transporting ATPase KdpF subunit